MKINTNNGDIKTIGDITEFKTGIDPKNLEYITTLLSSNLYSNPEQSFIREIVSNAWDSHVEAGTTDIPVIIRLDSINSTITIRDYGTGLSPERFKNIFCNIGSSTKRDTNDYIGGFGIGRFSALACSNVVKINSYYEGIEYDYLMVKSGNTITTNLINTIQNTKEKNGVSVSINVVPEDMHQYGRALQYLVFFPNIYVDTEKFRSSHWEVNNIVLNINNTKIKRFKYFSYADARMRHKILLGNVLYPCDNFKLDKSSIAFLRNIEYSGVVINFNIGEISITPNRESIIYTSETINIIDSRIREAKKEIEEIIYKNSYKDFDDIYDYKNMVSNSISFDFIELKCITESLCSDGVLSLSYEKSFKYFSFRGKFYTGNDLILNIGNTDYPNIKFAIYNDRVISKNYMIPDRFTRVMKNRDKVISVPKGFRCSQILKSYFRLYYDKYIILDGVTKDIIRDNLLEEYKNFENSIDFPFIINELTESTYKSIKFVDFNTDKDFLEYKKDYLDNNKVSKIKDTETIYLYQWNTEDYYECKNQRMYTGMHNVLKKIKSIHKLVIVDYISPANKEISDIVVARGAAYITANKKCVNKIFEANLSNVRNTEWLISKDKNASKYHTILKYLNKDNTYDGISVIDTIPKRYYKELFKLLDTYNNLYSSKISSYRLFIEKQDLPEDKYIALLCKRYLYYYGKYKKSKEFVVNNGFLGAPRVLINLAIIKNREYRVNYNTYKSFKSNKVINLLCRR